MIVLQMRGVRDSLRFRWAEWVSAGVMLAWGMNLLRPAESFNMSPSGNGAWSFLKSWAPEEYWGMIALGIGATRLTILFVNGRWNHENRHRARLLLAWGGCFLWASLLTSLLHFGAANTGIPVYAGYLLMDLGCIHIAAYDYARFKEARRDGILT